MSDAEQKDLLAQHKACSKLCLKHLDNLRTMMVLQKWGKAIREHPQPWDPDPQLGLGAAPGTLQSVLPFANHEPLHSRQSQSGKGLCRRLES